MSDDDLLKPIDIDLGEYGEDEAESNPAPPAEANPAPDIAVEGGLSPSEAASPIDVPAPQVAMPEEDTIQPIDVAAPAPIDVPPPAAPSPAQPQAQAQAQAANPAPAPQASEAPTPIAPEAPVQPASQAQKTNTESRFNQIKIGEQVNLTRMDPGLKKVLIGMGWDAKVFSDESTPDLDVSLFFLDKDDQTRENGDFLFYNNENAFDGGVYHHGDNRTGAGDGDDENITITLSDVPFNIVKIEVVLSIYSGLEREQSFNDVENIFFRIVNEDTRIELFRFELDRVVGGENAIGLKIGYFLREGPNWFFESEAIPVQKGLAEAAMEYGIVVQEMV